MEYGIGLKEKMTKYEMLIKISEVLKIPPEHIIPCKQSSNSKPHHVQFDISHTHNIINQFGDVTSISFFDSISLLLREYLITLEMVEKSFDR